MEQNQTGSEAEGLEPAGSETPSELVTEIADELDHGVPEADALEQSLVVEEEQIVDRSGDHTDVPEADWLEQSIAEPIDDEER